MSAKLGALSLAVSGLAGCFRYCPGVGQRSGMFDVTVEA
jgi:hypothetical protein